MINVVHTIRIMLDFVSCSRNPYNDCQLLGSHPVANESGTLLLGITLLKSTCDSYTKMSVVGSRPRRRETSRWEAYLVKI
jgi:hypothetical protein